MISCCRIPYFYTKFLKGDDGDMNRLRSKSKKEDKTACNARNLASGSIRLLNPAVCRERNSGYCNRYRRILR